MKKEMFQSRSNTQGTTLRAIGKENNRWLLLDLDGLLSTREDISIFTRDGFHFSKSGLALVASIESEFIARHILHKTLDIDNVSNSIKKH